MRISVRITKVLAASAFLLVASLWSEGTAQAECDWCEEPDCTTIRVQSQFGQVLHFNEFLRAGSSNAPATPDHHTGWADKVEEMAGGSLCVEVTFGDSVVPNSELFDAVNDGTLIDGAFIVPGIVDPAVGGLFGAAPTFGMDAQMMLSWYRDGGGSDLYHDTMRRNGWRDIEAFFFAPLPTQPLGWFRFEVTDPTDFCWAEGPIPGEPVPECVVDTDLDLSTGTGLRYRAGGVSAHLFGYMGANVVSSLGASPVGLFLVEPPLNLVAAEFNNPTEDLNLGFTDVTTDYMLQSYHQNGETLAILLNSDLLDSLSDAELAIIRYASMATSAESTWQYMLDIPRDLETIRDLGIEVHVTPESVLRAELCAWDRFVKDEQPGNPEFRRVLRSQREWAERVVGAWEELIVDNTIAYEHYFGDGPSACE